MKKNAISAAVAAAVPSAAMPREIRYTGADAVAVFWPADDTRGLQRIGDMRPGVEYVLPAADAIRLVDVKRFRYATADDAAAAARHVEQFNDAAPAPDPAAATAQGRGGIASSTQAKE